MRHSKGFTIVELLIVIVVIGILAAITIVAYGGIQNRTNDAAIQSDLNSIAKKIQLYNAQNGVYPTSSAQLSTLELGVTTSVYGNHYSYMGNTYNLLYCWPSTSQPNTFALIASSKSGNIFHYVNSKVAKATYSFDIGTSALCSSAGHPIESGAHRTWFHNVSEWEPFVNS